MKKLLLLLLLPAISSAEHVKSIQNPQTGRPDYITKVDTNTIIAGTNITESYSNGALTINSSGGGGSGGVVVPSTFTWTGVIVSSIQASSATLTYVSMSTFTASSGSIATANISTNLGVSEIDYLGNGNFGTIGSQTSWNFGNNVSINTSLVGNQFDVSGQSWFRGSGGATATVEVAPVPGAQSSAHAIRVDLTGAPAAGSNYGYYANVANAPVANYAFYDAAGSVNLQPLSASQFVQTDSNKNLASYDLFSASPTYNGQANWTSTAPSTFTVLAVTSPTINGVPYTFPTAVSAGGFLSVGTSSAVTISPLSASYRNGIIGQTWDGGGSALTTGTTYWVRVSTYSGITLSGFTLTGTPSGNMTVNVSSSSVFNTSPVSICASACPTFTSDTSSSNYTLAGWTTSIAAGGYIYFCLNTAATATVGSLEIDYTKP